MLPHLTVQAWWSQSAVGIVSQTTSESEIAALETRYSILIPDDFRTYLGEGAPKKENWDAEDGNWWPIGRIKNIPDEYEHAVSEPIASNASKHLIFLDYSIWCWAWAISCADDETWGKVALIGGLPDGYVADTFEEFVERYTNNWASISQVQKKAATPGRFRRWLRRSNRSHMTR
ncbi:SMI1/KNR4 family protein [Sphingomonas sp. YR710]|uniref:SMI1/KNR4 family protein n=1 Tax=Sphingomonas sp. YR710 TaxID=1882773 RepID=UPI000B88198E